MSESEEGLQSALRRAESRIQAMSDVGRNLTAIHDLGELLARVVPRVTELMEADRTTIFLVDPEREEIWSKVAEGDEIQEIRMPLDRGIAGWVARSGKPINIKDAYRDERFNPDVDRVTGYKTHSLLCVPLRGKQGDVLGAVQTLNKRGGHFTVEDEKLLGALGSQISIAIENAQLVLNVLSKNIELVEAQEALARKVEELDILFRLEVEIASALRAEEILARLLRQAVGVVGCEAGSILLVSEETGELLFTAAVGGREEEVRHMRLPRGAGVVGWVAEHGEAALVNTPSDDPRHLKEIEIELDFPVRSLLAVPLALGGERIGALELLNKIQGGFEPEDEKLATLIAGQAVSAVQLGRQREQCERDERLRSIGQALSGVIHDFRTPMTIISGYVQLMALEPDADKRARQSDVILRQFEFMNDMTRELLSFARGDTTLLLHRVHTDGLLKDMRELLQRELESVGVKLHIEDRYGGPLRVDENKLRRLIFNITRNACQAMPAGGDFRIRVEDEDGGVCFAFSDTGPGIPEEVRENLFEYFVTSGKQEGTGLGLAVVKKIVDEHGGRIEVDSAPGSGACFRIWLPKRL
ncbi:MAG: GAF domain-containing sensor histidine kinase [Deltaproteobacteria bacterium]|nr:GAF domain-containing sensor histidine kinase [Deltaproteobacteria bacterium]